MLPFSQKWSLNIAMPDSVLSIWPKRKFVRNVRGRTTSIGGQRRYLILRFKIVCPVPCILKTSDYVGSSFKSLVSAKKSSILFRSFYQMMNESVLVYQESKKLKWTGLNSKLWWQFLLISEGFGAWRSYS